MICLQRRRNPLRKPTSLGYQHPLCQRGRESLRRYRSLLRPMNYFLCDAPKMAVTLTKHSKGLLVLRCMYKLCTRHLVFALLKRVTRCLRQRMTRKSIKSKQIIRTRGCPHIFFPFLHSEVHVNRSIVENRESESMGDASEEETVRSGKKEKLDSPGNSMGDASEEEMLRSGKKEKLDSPGPAVDENYVNIKLKPKKRSASQVLVREYGSCTYSYVDPVKTYPAFQTFLKKNNGSLKEVLEKYMEQDISRIRTGSSKRSIAESRESESMEDASEEETVRSGKKEKLDSLGNSIGDASEEETPRSGKKEKLDSPGPVVDENYVNIKLKPKKRSASQVLVREYGSYTYSYVEPVKTYPAFQTFLKKNNGSLKEVLEKYMSQDISRIRTGSSKRSIAESRESMEDASEEETVRSGKKEKLESPGNSMGDATEEETPRSEKMEKLDSPGPVSST